MSWLVVVVPVLVRAEASSLSTWRVEMPSASAISLWCSPSRTSRSASSSREVRLPAGRRGFRCGGEAGRALAW